MDNEINLKSAYDSLQKKELEQRKTIKQISERIKELEAILSKNESLHLVSVPFCECNCQGSESNCSNER